MNLRGRARDNKRVKEQYVDRSRSTKALVPCFWCLLLLLAACGGGINQQPTLEAEVSNLVVSYELSALEGETTSGTIRVHVNAKNNYVEVRFHLNDSSDPASISKAVPYSFTLDTLTLEDGQHIITAYALQRNMRVAEIGRATFLVKNAADEPIPPPADEPTPPVDEPPPPADEPTPTTGSLAVEVTPNEGTVTITGPDNFTTTFIGDHTLELQAGSYTVSATLEGYDSKMATADVKAGESTQVALSLSRIVTITPQPSLYDYLEQLHVDVNNGSDNNPGTAQAPFKTLNAAFDQAIRNRTNGLGSRILLYPGTYREGIDRSYGLTIGNASPLIVVEAVEAGTAIISGSDIFSNWTCSGAMCTHSWTHNWGFSSNPWPGQNVGPLALRREVVFVDGVRLEQRLSLTEVQALAGSYFVDDAGGHIHMHLPSGVSLHSATVEVAMRERLFVAQRLSNIVLKGLVFQHAATRLGNSAVYFIDQNNVLVEDVLVQHNNSDGLTFARANDVIMRNSVMNHNGASGTGAWRTQRVLLEDNETSYNNWRGAYGNFHGWAIGQKFMVSRDLTIRRLTSRHNMSRGLWMDWDMERVLIEDVILEHNYLDGLFLEVLQGPVMVRNSVISHNYRSGILTSALNNAVIENNRIEGNGSHAFFLSGSFNVKVTKFDTGEVIYLNNENWRISNNVVSAPGTQLLYFTSYFPDGEWDRLMNSSVINANSYTASVDRAFQPFGIAAVNFSNWQERTKQDSYSMFSSLLASTSP